MKTINSHQVLIQVWQQRWKKNRKEEIKIFVGREKWMEIFFPGRSVARGLLSQQRNWKKSCTESQVLRGELRRVKSFSTTDPMNRTPRRKEKGEEKKIKNYYHAKGFPHSSPFVCPMTWWFPQFLLLGLKKERKSLVAVSHCSWLRRKKGFEILFMHFSGWGFDEEKFNRVLLKGLRRGHLKLKCCCCSSWQNL